MLVFLYKSALGHMLTGRKLVYHFTDFDSLTLKTAYDLSTTYRFQLLLEFLFSKFY